MNVIRKQLHDSPSGNRQAKRLRAEFVALRNRVVSGNLRLVIAAATHFRSPDCPLEELVAEGMLPLIRAAELFDPSRGFRFSTYATHAVRNHLLRVRKRTSRRRSHETILSSGDESVEPVAVDAGFGRLQKVEDCRKVREALKSLTKREQRLLRARFGLDTGERTRTFQDIADDVGLSKERVRVLTNRALRTLREHLCESAA